MVVFLLVNNFLLNLWDETRISVQAKYKIRAKRH